MTLTQVKSNRTMSKIARVFAAILFTLLSVGFITEPASAATGRPAPAFTPADTSSIETENVQQLADGLAYYALVACVIGMIVSASLWAMGSKGQNPGQELTGKKGFVLCCTAAFFVGATPAFVNYLNRAADTINTENGIAITQTLNEDAS